MTANDFNRVVDPMIGAVLGNYRIMNALSTGGMGSVYRARHELLGRPAAIKLLRPELTENDELVQRFFNEAKAATEIRHPAIVEVYDFGYTTSGHAYLVMELLDGQTLARTLAERGRFDEPEAAQIARSIASALKGAHAKGIVHRDLKPDNIFLVPDPDGGELRVKILDFGIAKLANPTQIAGHRRTLTGVLLGTPKYMAPEQAREAATIDARADLYSLGCIVYELLVGAPPFVADGAGELIAMQLFNEPEPPSARVAVTPELERLVLRLLAKEPAERPQTAAEVMERLGARRSRDAAAAHQPSVVDHTSIRVEVAPPAKRSRAPLAIAAAIAAAAAIAVAVLVSREAPSGPAPPPAIVETRPAVDTGSAANEAKPAALTPPPAIVTLPPTTIAPPVAPPATVHAKQKPAKVKATPTTATAPPPSADKPDHHAPPNTDRPTTDNHSPIETDIGDGPRRPKPP